MDGCTPNADLLEKVEDFLGQTGMRETTFGRKAVSDPNLITDLRNGRELRSATVARVRALMQTHQ